MNTYLRGYNGITGAVVPLAVLPLPPNYRQSPMYGQPPLPPGPPPPLERINLSGVKWTPPLPKAPLLPSRKYRTTRFLPKSFKRNSTQHTYIISNPYVQSVCLSILSEINQLLIDKGYAKDCRFFLRGTNAVPLIHHIFSPGEYHFPYNFSSDFDYEILINPGLPDDRFNEIHRDILDIIFGYIINVSKNNKLWPIFSAAAEQFGIYIPELKSDFPLYKSNSYTKRNFTTENAYNIIPKDSPFYLYKVNDFITSSSSELTNLSQVKFGLRILNNDGSKKSHFVPMELIDISIPKKSNDYIKRLWNITSDGLYLYNDELVEHPVAGLTPIEFNVIDLPSAVLNLEYAANKNTRKNKQNRRRTASDTLRRLFNSKVMAAPMNVRNQTIRRARNLKLIK
jgi:hypothetical protein